jgi:hypothetical protein
MKKTAIISMFQIAAQIPFQIAAIVVLCFAFSPAAWSQNPNSPPAQGFPIGPPGKILSFTAEPSSIQPGQTVTLKWAAVNADRITIDQGVGVVATRGTQTVTPQTTTIYTLRAVGRGGADAQSITVTVAGTAAPTPAPAAAASANVDVMANLPIPHLDDGTPDLSGVYIGGFGIRHPDNIKLKPGAEKYNVGMDYGGDLGAHCLPPGVPGVTEQPYPIQIIEKRGLVVILYEAYHLFRVIPTDDSPHPADLDPTWLGNSVGHWEGDTLVVDVTAFNDKTAVGGFRHTTAYHVVEHYKRTAYDKIQYEAIIDDPNVFAAPFTVAGSLQLHPEWQIQEYICEENNHDYNDLIDKFKK